MSRQEPISVLLTTEGTYPFYTGGVSTWCHRRTHEVPNIDFTVLAVGTNPSPQSKYELAPHGRVECAPVRVARCMGVSSPTYGTANSRRSEASLPFAVSLADGASLPHSSLGHRTFIGGVFLWSALCAGKTCEWHTLYAD